MMFKIVFLLLLFAHLLGDYYLQTQKFVEQKEKSIFKVLIHGAIYAFCCFSVILVSANKWLIIAAAISSATHLFIDLIKWIVVKTSIRQSAEMKRNLYIFDQIIHICIIFSISVYVSTKFVSINIFPAINQIFNTVGIEKMQFISWICILMLIWKPANIFIKNVLSDYKPIENEIFKNKINKNTGGFIGLLERLLVLLLLSINQYSAIGLILTAKSIARYNKISENKEFAEYYLLGTLLSTAIVIFSYIILA